MAPVAKVGRAALLALGALRGPCPAEGARVVSDELHGEALLELGLHGAGVEAQPSFRLEGVPVFGALPMPKMRLAPGQPEPAREWIVILKPNATDDEVGSIGNGSTSCNDNVGCFQGHPTEGGVPFVEVSLSDGDLGAVLRRHAGRVDFVEADLPVSIIPEMPGSEESSNLSENGSLLQAGYPWGINKVGADRDRRGGLGVHVYVMDTGIRTTHRDFGGRAVPTLETYNNYVRECSSRDTNCAADRQGHGTHCAGTVGGVQSGVAPQASLHAVKAMGDQGEGTVSNIISAIDWVVRRGQRPSVLSMSLGGQGRVYSYQRAVDSAVQAGLVVVVAAGNDNDDACQYNPAYVPSAITVGATTYRGQRSGFSNYGSCVNIFAPGSDIQSASHRSDYGYATQSGTSMACPHVAGAAAKLLQSHTSWNQYSVFEELGRTGQHNVVYDARGSANLMLRV
jgi:subtilisin family serine protease